MTVQTPADMSTMPSPAEEAALPTCPCGHDRNHYRVSRDGEFRAWSWILLMFGVSARPIRVDWRCRMCDVTFDSTTDPDILRRRLF